MMIDILYFPDCPNYLPAVEHVQTALQEEHALAEIKHVQVSDTATATATRFLGSPTIRINGIDIEPSARSGGAAGMCCRTYCGQRGPQGAPSVALIRNAIRELTDRRKDCRARE
ncbi:MAG TPA: hypothetical protein VKB88_29610 [Bryobacteraceae bacterium]|nr:hypothetical protein [Bryobacteraceae bacterium]